MSLVVPSTSFAQDCQKTLNSCERAVGLCKEALDLKNQEIQLCRLGLQQAINNGVDLKFDLDAANAKLNSPLRNPFFIGTVGVLIGLVVAGIATK